MTPDQALLTGQLMGLVMRGGNDLGIAQEVVPLVSPVTGDYLPSFKVRRPSGTYLITVALEEPA